MQYLKTFKNFILYLSIFFLLTLTPKVLASENSFVSVVNPVRGGDFWDVSEKPKDAIDGEANLLKKYNIDATWLIRFDALEDNEIITSINSLPSTHEKGLFLEITPTWTKATNITYRKSITWHSAGSIFLTGYLPKEREALIDVSFEKFKSIFGYYPKSVGAWWIDSYSLGYMQKKYDIISALIVADQYTTDNYQIWGQFWSVPFYPSITNALTPARTLENKLPVVMMQWATRDPVNGYGDGVKESTYSVQANDYIDYHALNTDYFSKLIDIYTLQKLNQFNQIVVGLENSYSWNKYKDEYANQIKILFDKKLSGQIDTITMKGFADWYKVKFPNLSPEQIIIAKDPLGTDKTTVWYMNPYYRAGWFYNKDGSAFRDIRQYVDGQIEPCFTTSCNVLNFATFSTRVLDDITYKQKLILDVGKISDLEVKKNGQDYILSYQNEANRKKQIEFKPRDISIDGEMSTIDGLILKAISKKGQNVQLLDNFDSERVSSNSQQFFNFFINAIKFLLFILICLFIPGFVLAKHLAGKLFIFQIFVSIIIGFVNLTLVAYLVGLLKIPWAIFIYIILFNIYFFYKQLFKEIYLKEIFSFVTKRSIFVILTIILGTFFQSLALIRSGWEYNFGIGFWGPLGHDGIWHQALINQLIKAVPPVNPAFSGQFLSNYHYFYDLLLATTFRISQIPILDLLYRFYPVLFSLLLGFGTYLLVNRFYKSTGATLAALYFVYFAGSFGWIIEYLRERHFGGESAFWVNQPVSMNLNPPFAISLLIIIAIILVLQIFNMKKNLLTGVVLAILVGSLVEFKVYAGVIVLISLSIISVWQLLFQKNFLYLKVLIGSVLLSAGVFLPQNSSAGDLLVFSPFWFVHSMIDFPDRVGWLKLSQARLAYFARGEWLKFFMTEGLALFLFIIGNLGTRFIGLVAIVIFIKKGFWKQIDYMFILIIVISALVIPILFIQKGNPWNTIQFFYYLLYFVAIFAGIILALIFKLIIQTKKIFLKISGLLILVFFIIITPINAVVTFRSAFYQNPPSRLTFGEMEALEYLEKLPEGVILTYPHDKNFREKTKDPYPLFIYETTSYVAAFSGKQTFIEDEIQQEILQNSYKKRLVASQEFFDGRDIVWSRNFLLKNKIRYIYLPKIFNESLDITKLGLNNIYENKEAKILEVIN